MRTTLPGSTLSATELLVSQPSPARPKAKPVLMVTWAVEEKFGGMTAMCLKRAGLFHEQGTPSAIVTFDAIPDFARIHSTVILNKKLNPEVPLLNLHEYYAELCVDPKSGPPILPRGGEVEWTESTRVTRSIDDSLFYIVENSAGNDKLTRRTYLRPTGSTYLVDVTAPSPKNPEDVVRHLQLFRADGSIYEEFSSAAKLYRHWLTELVDRTDADVIVDSKYAAGFLSSWKHPGAVKFVNFHSTHITPGQDVQTGKISPAHEKIVRSREVWDGITFLTESQRQAFVGRFGDDSNTVVISNPVNSPTSLPVFGERTPAQVLHVGRLTKGKNVHAVINIIEAVAASGTHAHLNLVGDGDQRSALEEFVKTRGIEDLVTFHGHVEDVEQRLAATRVLLLCSKFEGQSLAILEAQAQGCVPVAFDVDFGPRDVIVNASNGFLVPFGDNVSAAAAVVQLLDDDALCQNMATKAFKTAHEFSSEKIFGLWNDALQTARMNKKGREILIAVTAKVAGMRFHSDGTIDLEVQLGARPRELTVHELHVSERGNNHDPGFRTGPSMENDGILFFKIPAMIRSQLPGGAALDLAVEFTVDGITRSIRLGAEPKLQSVPYFTAYGNLSIK